MLVVFEKNHIEILRPSVLENFQFVVVDSSVKPGDLSGKLLIALLKCFSSFFLNSKNVRAFLYSPLRIFKRLWIMAKVLQHKPKAVLTIIDNNGYFHWLCEYCSVVSQIRFIAIQNGNRLEQDFIECGRKKAFHDIYFCFGAQEEASFIDWGFRFNELIAVGSCFADIFRDSVAESNVESVYDVAVVSSWQGELEYTTDRLEMYRSADVTHRLMSRLALETGIKVVVLMGSNADSEFGNTSKFGDELSYLNSIYGDAVTYIHRSKFSTYKGMHESRVVVGFMTTSVKEAYGWGKRILYCDFSGTKTFTPYLDKIVLRDPDYEIFKKRILGLLAVSDGEYTAEHIEYQKHLMNFSKKKRTHEIIREKLIEIGINQ